jgi:hypothetical protein
LSENFPIQNVLKQGDVLSSLLFNFIVEYAIRKVQENWMGLKLNGAFQFLPYAEYLNLLGDNVITISITSKEVGLEINVEETKYML